jgi:hypothetical protein
MQSLLQRRAASASACGSSSTGPAPRPAVAAPIQGRHARGRREGTAGGRAGRGGRAVARAVADEVETLEQELANMTDEKRDIQKLMARPYKYGFKTIIESDTFPKVRPGARAARGRGNRAYEERVGLATSCVWRKKVFSKGRTGQAYGGTEALGQRAQPLARKGAHSITRSRLSHAACANHFAKTLGLEKPRRRQPSRRAATPLHA